MLMNHGDFMLSSVRSASSGVESVRAAAGRKSMQSGLDMLQEMVEDHPEQRAWLLDQAWGFHQLAGHLDEPHLRLEYLNREIQCRGGFLRLEPTRQDVLRGLAYAYQDRADVEAQNIDRIESAAESAQCVLGYLDRVDSLSVEDEKRVAEAHNVIAAYEFTEGRLDEAMRHQAKARNIWSSIHERTRHPKHASRARLMGQAVQLIKERASTSASGPQGAESGLNRSQRRALKKRQRRHLKSQKKKK